MYIHLFAYDWITVLAGVFAAAVLVVWFVVQAASRAGVTNSERRLVIAAVSAYLATWYALYLVLAARGLFHYSPAVPFPFLGLAIAAPLLTAVLATLYWRPLRAVVAEIPQQQLIGVQALRVVGFTFLMLLGRNLLPPQFALPAGFGDVLVGIDAVFVARMYARRSQSARAYALVWNVAGILDLVVALGIGFFASTSPLRLLDLTPSTDIMTSLPFAMIPLFGVPLYLALHVTSLRRTLGELRGASSLGRSASHFTTG